MREAARNFDWTYVSGISSAFGTHGYGDWLRTAADSVIQQGPIGNRNFPSTEERTNTRGTMHPMAGGLAVQRDRIKSALTLPNLHVQHFTVSPEAFRGGGANSTFALAVANKSYGTASAPTTAVICISHDPFVTDDDLIIATVNIPALAPFSAVSIHGTLPHISDPFQNVGNVFYVGAVIDPGALVAESNEVDNEMNPSRVPQVQSELDLAPSVVPALAGPVVTLNTVISTFLGTDEPIGARDIDTFRFNVSAGERVGFDVDAEGSLNTHVRLYRVIDNSIVTSFAPIAQNENGLAPGEAPAIHNPNESYLSHTFAEAGEYVLVVSHTSNRAVDPMRVPGRLFGEEGPYQLNVSRQESIPPELVGSTFDVNENRLRFDFSEDVSTSFFRPVLTLQNLTTGTFVQVTPTLSNGGKRAEFTFPNFPAGLELGNYRATIVPGSIIDASGNQLGDDVTLNFFALPGDANRDRAVNINDFAVLAARFNTPGTFTQGDFNYSGRVDINDFAILAGSFNRQLELSRGAMPPRGSPFATRAIDETLWKQIENV